MLYPITRPLATLALSANYRKIILSHTERIPKDKPVILAANHPTAFIEPCILACFLDRPLYFLVRGDFFKKSFYEGLLRDLHMLPVYRMRDGGYSNIKQNYATFESCFNALRDNKTMMILAEGRCIHEKRLRPLRKGTARVAMGALDKYPDIGEVYVVPAGVNYTYADQTRSEILIDFGEPILVSEYMEAYQAQPNQAITAFTDELRRRMLERVLVIEQPKDEELTERLLVMYRSDHPEKRFPILEKDPERLQGEMQIAGAVNESSEEDKAQLWRWLDLYFDKLDMLGLSDAVISSRYQSGKNWPALLFVIAFPLYAIGRLWTYLPLALAKWVVDKNVRHVEFYEPVRVAVAIGSFLVWSIIWLLIGASLVGWWNIPLVAALLGLGYFAVIYREKYQDWQMKNRLNKVAGEEVERLKEERARIMDHFATSKPLVK
ncbi:MAG: 1-acyl-sn-glycerol-3-phosphate acyltransferase [Saprospiraceae bacterium]|nr:1-acyl-sn-glycerol-3-phosphate acyltransferase [Lewinella sp.]